MMLDPALHLILRLGGVPYAVPVRQVREVVPFERPVPVPRAPDFVAGVVNHHGRIVTLIDLGRFLRVSNGRAAPTHVVILARDDVLLGIPCEGVLRITALGEVSATVDVPVVDLDEALGSLEPYFG